MHPALEKQYKMLRSLQKIHKVAFLRHVISAALSTLYHARNTCRAWWYSVKGTVR